MRRRFIQNIFCSNYCKLVFFISLILNSIIIPKNIFYSYYSILGIVFIFVSSLVLTCFIRVVKEKIVSAKHAGASFGGILSVLFGFGAMHFCSVGAPVCGASLGAGIMALFFPGAAINFFKDYSILIIFVSLMFQLVALYFLGCFRRVGSCES